MPHPPERYSFLHALRPFSLPVAAISCLTGIIAASPLESFSPVQAVMVLVAGLILQAGVNLINDHGDLKNPAVLSRLTAQQKSNIEANFRYGLGSLTTAAVIGLYLLTQSHPQLIGIGLVGMVGAYGYAAPPLKYKERALGLPLVFLLMGVLMVYGSYLGAGGVPDTTIIWISLPCAFLTVLLLLANEIRDFEADTADALHTFTVRFGLSAARSLYVLLVVISYASVMFLEIKGLLVNSWIVLFALPLLAAPLRSLKETASGRKRLPPLTGRYFLFSGINLLMSLYWATVQA